jgi:hypothetical protein
MAAINHYLQRAQQHIENKDKYLEQLNRAIDKHRSVLSKGELADVEEAEEMEALAVLLRERAAISSLAD